MAGSLKDVSVGVSRRLRCVIQTAPSTVARQIAPLRWAMISPARPRSARSWWAPKRWNSRALDLVEDAGVALRGADLADHAVGGVRVPVDRADVLRHEHARAAGDRGVLGVGRGRRRRRSCRPPPRAPRSRRGGPRGGTGCSCRPRACGRCAWPTPRPHRSRRWPRAPSRPTRRIPSSIAQSSDDGPRSPLGPGCTTRQRCFAQIDSGIIVLSIGQTISCGRCSLTAASIAAAESTTATVTSWPSSVSAIQAR